MKSDISLTFPWVLQHVNCCHRAEILLDLLEQFALSGCGQNLSKALPPARLLGLFCHFLTSKDKRILCGVDPCAQKCDLGQAFIFPF